MNIPDEIPDKPHPNCNCYIEEVPEDESLTEEDYETNSDSEPIPEPQPTPEQKPKPKEEPEQGPKTKPKKRKDEEMCDCWEFFDNIDDILSDAESLNENVSADILDIENIESKYSDFDSNYIQGIINDIVSLEDPLNTLWQTISIFISNYNQMKDANTKGADKYFHAKANCEAAQRGIVGSVIAEAISNLREYTDNYRNIREKKMSLEKSLKDIEEDQKANKEGRDLGRKYPTVDPYDLLKHKIPNGFPDRYKKFYLS